MAHLFDWGSAEYNHYTSTNPLREYMKQASEYLMQVRGVSREVAVDFVRKIIRNDGYRIFKNPIVHYYHRDLKTGDKEERSSTLYSYITTASEEGLIRVPSFTCYYNHSQKTSLLVGYLEDGIAYRNKYKKLALSAAATGDKESYNLYNPQQLAAKKQNNSVSGLLSSRSTPLYNYSAHYTLTSMTRCVSSIGNGVSEKMIANNKNYQTPISVYGDILATIEDNDYTRKLTAVIDKYGLYKPTAEEVLADILESTKYYWSNKQEEQRLLELLDSLSPNKRAIFTYAGCLYTLKKYNPELMKQVITAFTTIPGTDIGDIDILKTAPAAVINLTHHICADRIKGLGTNYSDMPDDIVALLAKTAHMVTNVFSKYRDLIYTISTSHVAPPNLATIKTMMRKAVVLSDTDSTCATYQEWVRDYFGGYIFSQDALSVASVIMTITTESTGHYLLMYSAMMGVPTDKRDLLDMKNEFTWHTMTPSNVAKHYFADTIVREGGVFNEGLLELKGAHFIASLLPQPILDYRKKLIIHLHSEVASNKKVSLTRILKEVMDLESLVISEIEKGTPEYFNTGKINSVDAYKTPLPNNPYIRHIFWNDTFAKHGGYKTAPEPPYSTISVSTKLDTKARMEYWLSGLSNQKLANAIREFLITYNKKSMPIIHVNPQILDGIPKEIIPVINVHELVLKVMNPVYMILENIGFYRKPHLLVREMFKKQETVFENKHQNT